MAKRRKKAAVAPKIKLRAMNDVPGHMDVIAWFPQIMAGAQEIQNSSLSSGANPDQVVASHQMWAQLFLGILALLQKNDQTTQHMSTSTGIR